MSRSATRYACAVLLGWSTGMSSCYSMRNFSQAPPEGTEVIVNFQSPRSLVINPNPHGRGDAYSRTVENVASVAGRVLSTYGDTVVLRVAWATTASRWGTANRRIANVEGTAVQLTPASQGVRVTSTHFSGLKTAGFLLLIPLTILAALVVVLNLGCAGAHCG